MQASDRNLIQRLLERNADHERATDRRIHPRKLIPPPATKILHSAELEIGFKLPELLRTIYLSVGNGGFGPAYGIVGTKGGAKLDGRTLETCYREMTKLEAENSLWRWPKSLLPLANYGCGMWSCVDCKYKKLPMILWDPNNLNAGLDGDNAQLNWGNAFWDQRQSLRTWLEGWLADKPEPEPKWPSDSWMSERLGFTLRK